MAFTLGEGCIASGSTKQKINTRSSTESELVGVDDYVSPVLWYSLFITAQGFDIKPFVHRDNTSSLKLEVNGKASSGKRTRHFNIKYFYITDLIKRGLIQAVYCPTKLMMADYMSKPLTGTLFKYMRAWILNLPEYQTYKNIVTSQKKEKTNKAITSHDGQYRSVLDYKVNGKMTDDEFHDSETILHRVRKAAQRFKLPGYSRADSAHKTDLIRGKYNEPVSPQMVEAVE